eukprot:1160827-Pelagomonas_calceolata.AAC.18
MASTFDALCLQAVPGSIPSSLMAAAREPLPSSSAERVRPIVPPFPSASGAGTAYDFLGQH